MALDGLELGALLQVLGIVFIALVGLVLLIGLIVLIARRARSAAPASADAAQIAPAAAFFDGDQDELIAVIAAAISAYAEKTGSQGGLIVRRVRRLGAWESDAKRRRLADHL